MRRRLSGMCGDECVFHSCHFPISSGYEASHGNIFPLLPTPVSASRRRSTSSASSISPQSRKLACEMGSRKRGSGARSTVDFGGSPRRSFLALGEGGKLPKNSPEKCGDKNAKGRRTGNGRAKHGWEGTKSHEYEVEEKKRRRRKIKVLFIVGLDGKGSQSWKNRNCRIVGCARALVRFVPVRPFVLGQKAILTCTRPRFTL